MADNPKVCRYMDIPLQHISDPVLANMHRHVDGAWTRELIRRMRERVPGVVLRTTMIVGHPGETPYAFRQLLQFVEEARFERLGAFTYSREEDTPAYSFENQIDEQVKETLDIMAPGGGYLFTTGYSLEDCPEENMDAVLEALEKYGKY